MTSEFLIQPVNLLKPGNTEIPLSTLYYWSFFSPSLNCFFLVLIFKQFVFFFLRIEDKDNTSRFGLFYELYKLGKTVGTVSLCLVYLPKAINLFLKKMRSHHSFGVSAESIPYQKSAAANISSTEILVFPVTQQQQQQQKSIFIKLGRTVHGGWLNSFHRPLRRFFHQSHPNSRSSQCTLVEFTDISGAVLGTEVNSKLKHSAPKSPWKESWAATSDVQEEC